MLRLLTGIFCFFIALKTPLIGGIDEEELKRCIQEEKPFQGSHIGVAVKDGESYLFLHNAGSRFVPASVTKLITTGLALKELGPSFRFQTEAAFDGALTDGVLDGNLYLIGGGDPSLNHLAIQELADQVKSFGIREIKGNVIADISLFGTETFPTDAEWQDLQEYYAAEISPLSLNGNTVEVAIDRETGEALCDQAAPYCSLEGSVGLKEGEACMVYVRPPEAHCIKLSGAIQKGAGKETFKVSVHKPSEYARLALIEALKARAVKVRSEEKSKGERKAVAKVLSEPLTELLREVNHMSNNLYAETLLRYIAKKKYPEMHFPEGESLVLKEYLIGMGAEEEDFVLREGAGLSRHNLLKPEGVVRFLETAAKSPYGEAFIGTLAIAGKDGKLEMRFKELEDGLVIRAKTGGLEGVANLAGVAETKEGRKIFFCVFVNGSVKSYKETAASVDKLVLLLLKNQEGNSAKTLAGKPEAETTLGNAATTIPPV